MKKEIIADILGAVYSLTYSLYPIEMNEERNALVRRALQWTCEDPTQREVEGLLFELHQSKYDLNPGCQCLFGKGYYPDDFTDGLRKLERQDETGEAARELFAVLQRPNPEWEPEELYAAIRATYNNEYGAERIREIKNKLIAEGEQK